MIKLITTIKQKILEDVRADDAWLGGYQFGFLTAACWTGLFGSTAEEVFYMSLGVFVTAFLLRLWAKYSK